jgi:hypothetical protein
MSDELQLDPEAARLFAQITKAYMDTAAQLAPKGARLHVLIAAIPINEAAMDAYKSNKNESLRVEAGMRLVSNLPQELVPKFMAAAGAAALESLMQGSAQPLSEYTGEVETASAVQGIPMPGDGVLN